MKAVCLIEFKFCLFLKKLSLEKDTEHVECVTMVYEAVVLGFYRQNAQTVLNHADGVKRLIKKINIKSYDCKLSS